MPKDCFRLMAVLIFVFLANFLPLPAHAQSLWFAPGDGLNIRGVVAHPDFEQLFNDDAPWKTGYSHINVFQDGVNCFVRTPVEKLQPMLAFLKKHHIAIAISDQVLPRPEGSNGVEGMTSLRQIAVDMKKLKERGVDLEYVVMDEPLYFGHDYDGPNSSQFSIHDVAEGVAKSVRLIRSYYPDVKFVLVEPLQGLKGGAFELSRFLDLYQFMLHELPVAVRADLQWQNDWQQKLPPLIEAIKKHSIGYSVIFNGRGIDKDDASWVSCAKSNVIAYKKAFNTPLHHVVLQTWNPNPHFILPESDGNTMSGFLKWYVSRYHDHEN